jgi:hypothetical protein
MDGTFRALIAIMHRRFPLVACTASISFSKRQSAVRAFSDTIANAIV